jgi:hypothetical protein
MDSKLLVSLLLSLSLTASFGASFFVDYVGGSDAAAGTSTGTAFQHIPGDTAATGTAASTTLTGGDSVILKGGVSYVVPTNAIINLSWNGSSSSSVVYYGTNGAWGSGRAIITDNHAVSPGTLRDIIYAGSLRKFIRFDGLHFYEIAGSQTLPADPGVATNRNSARAINFSASLTNVTVANCKFEQIGYYWSAKPMDDSAVSGLGIQAVNSDGLTVTNCEFTQMSIGVETAAFGGSGYTTNLTVVDCSFHNSIRWCVDMGATASGAQLGAINLHRNACYNFGEFGATTWTGYGDWPHVDAFFLRRDVDGTRFSTNNDSTGINFFGNTFYDTNQSSANGTSCIYVTGGPSANIYSNVFIHTLKGWTIYVNGGPPTLTTPQVVRIYNNTFVEDYQSAIGLTRNTAYLDQITIRDNIFYDVREGSSVNYILAFSGYPVATNLTVNYNIYSTRNTSGNFISWPENGAGGGGMAFMQLNSLEANGQTNNPVFVDISYGSGYQCNLNDLHLQSSSPARGAGTGGGDIGAFPYASGGGSTPYRGFQFGSGVKLINGVTIRQ